MQFFIRWVANAAGFFTAILVVPGIHTSATRASDLAVVVLIAGLINSVLGPILKLFSLPFIIFTLGMGLLLINMALFWLVGTIGQNFGLGFTVSSFWAALGGAIIVSVVSSLLGTFLANGR